MQKAPECIASRFGRRDLRIGNDPPAGCTMTYPRRAPAHPGPKAPPVPARQHNYIVVWSGLNHGR